MSVKYWVMLGLVVGSSLGGWIPSFWDPSVFSAASTIGTFVGGILGVWLGYKIGLMFS